MTTEKRGVKKKYKYLMSVEKSLIRWPTHFLIQNLTREIFFFYSSPNTLIER